MRYALLACDYDETIALHSHVDEATVAALRRLTASGRKLVLVTGRLVGDLLSVFPEAQLFSRIVAENGGVLYDPATRTRRSLGARPPPEFVTLLETRGVAPVSVGDVIVATREPHEAAVLSVIRELGLGHQVIFNKGAVMVLPSGVDKGTGLCAALEELGLSMRNVVGVGDAENDHAFLQRCELSAAVRNALPLLRQRADVVMRGEAGAGVVELIDEMVATDLSRYSLSRHQLKLGTTEDGRPFTIPPYGTNVLIAGPSGSGKSQTTMALLERIIDAGYQGCMLDPEGDYRELDSMVSLGEPDKAPSIDEVLQLMKKPAEQVVVNLLGVPLADRPGFFATLLPQLQALRARTGRPHWILVDEAHHLLPSSWDPAPLTVPQGLASLVAVTVHPGKVSPAILKTVKLVLAVGANPGATFASFAEAIGQPPPRWPHRRPEHADEQPKEGAIVAWSPMSREPPVRVEVTPARWVHLRHRRKYAHGDLGKERSFYFRGPEGKLNLRAQNLMLFLQIADGVDESTWLYHLRRGDYSRWLRDDIKDENLAKVVEGVERNGIDSADATRSLVRRAIEERYTLPA